MRPTFGVLKNLSNDQHRFQQLSSMVQPGLSEIEFRNLFTCGVCGLIKMREVFVFHLCPAEVTDSDNTDVIIEPSDSATR